MLKITKLIEIFYPFWASKETYFSIDIFSSQSRTGNLLEHVCSVFDHENQPPRNYKQSIVCPEGCKEYRMAELSNNEKKSYLTMFNIEQDGITLSINESLDYRKVNFYIYLLIE